MGGVWSIITDNLFPGDAKYSVNDIPDMSGKVVLITGGTAGIGKETARVLLTKNAKVWITARDITLGETHTYSAMDLANLNSIKAAAEEFLSQETQLNVLFNNAGVMVPPLDQLTDDGYDLQFGTNVLGHFYFTKLVLPVLLSTAKSAPDGIARVVNTSSNAHWAGALKFETCKDGPARRRNRSFHCMGRARRSGNIIFSAELKRRYGDQGIVSTSLNPGGIRTELTAHVGSFKAVVLNSMMYDVSYGAITQLYAGTVPDGASLNGKYLIPWARVGKPRSDTQDPQLGKELWTWLEEQVGNV
ncbi:hypothetical protein BU15DRAFT_89589 [Melanogaster broomeanus]|nr:hypothetical protein BU15DRAFT_89589 [Melanogaster broomeanus]